VSRYFFYHIFSLLMLLYPLQYVGESLCIAFEACIHASKGAQVPHENVGLIEIHFNLK
jgi:hypothetical protein